MNSPRSEVPRRADVARVEIERARLGDSPSRVAASLGLPYAFVAGAFEALDLVVDADMTMTAALRQVGVLVDQARRKGRHGEYARLSPAARERKLARERARRANESPEEREARLAARRARKMARRDGETPEQHEARLRCDRDRGRAAREARRPGETEEEHARRVQHLRERRARAAAKQRRNAMAAMDQAPMQPGAPGVE